MYSDADTKDAFKLMLTKQAVNAANMEGLAILPGPTYSYTCYDGFKVTEGHEGKYEEYKESQNWTEDGERVRVLKKLTDHRYAARVKLKVGARIILLSNLNVDAGLCNGSQGIVVGFKPFDWDKVPSKENGKVGVSYGRYKTGHIEEFCRRQTGL